MVLDKIGFEVIVATLRLPILVSSRQEAGR